MKSFEEYEIEVWERALKETRKKAEDIEKWEDPVGILIKIQLEFVKLLNDNKGDARLTDKFRGKVEDLSRKEEEAKSKIESGSDLVKNLDNKHELQFRITEIKSKLFMLKLRRHQV